MYATRPPPYGKAPETPLGVLRAERLVFDAPSDLARDPVHLARLRVYLTDLLRPYGLELEPGILDHGRGQSYGEMAETVMGMAIAPDDAVDLVVLAYAIPDITPGRATAAYLSHICPGNRLAFAVCDQGVAAAFTGLRLIREYARTGGCRRALLVVVEQAELPYDTGEPVAIPAGHRAVAVLCGDPADGPGRAGGLEAAGLETVRVRADVPPERAGAVLAADVAALSAGRPDVTLIVGGGLAADSLDLQDVDRLRIAPAGRPYAGVWWELAGELAEPKAGRVVFADYDPGLRYLCLAALDVVVTRPSSTSEAPSGTAVRLPVQRTQRTLAAQEHP